MRNIDAALGTVTKHQGFAKTNRFRVDINLPSILNQAIGGYSLETVNMMCESVSLPSRSLSTNEYMNGFQTKKIPYTFIDEDVNMEFNLTADYYAKLLFDTWVESIINPSNFVAEYKNNYTADIVIYGQDLNDNNIYIVKLINAFPISVGDVNLSNANENTIGKVQVSFAYDRFEFESGTITNVPPPIVNVPNALNGLAQLPGIFGDIFSLASDLNGEFSTLNQAVTNFNTVRNNIRNTRATLGTVRNLGSLSARDLPSAGASITKLQGAINSTASSFGKLFGF